nr:dynamin family protein [Armatimonadota bacterium]
MRAKATKSKGQTPEPPEVQPSEASASGIRTLEDYGRVQAAVVSAIHEIGEAADSLPLANGSHRLREAATRLEGGVFTLLVLGDFKTGKSSFLNALLGMDVLPTAVTPCTAVLATIQYSEESYVKVQHFGGDADVISLETFANDYCLSTREADNERFGDIEQVEIGLPADLCRDRVRIVDSPGLDESPQRTAITSSHIPRSDAAVFMMGADRLGREHEMAYLQTHILGQGLDNVFFLINRTDLIEESMYPEREREALQARAWQLLAPPGAGPVSEESLESRHIYFMSARWAREAERSNDAELLARSGLPQLRARLERFLAHDRGRVAIQRPANLARETADAVRRGAEYRLNLLNVSLADLDERIAQTQPDFDRISRARSQAEKVIASQQERCRADLAVRLRQKVAELQDNMRRVVSRFEFPGGDSFTGRLTASVKMEPVQRAVAEQLDQYLSKEFSTWIREVEGVVQHHLESMTEQLGDNARQVHQSLSEIQIKILGPQVSQKAAEQMRDPVERLMALQESVRQGEFSTVLKETEALWKGTARTLAAQFAGMMLLGMLGLSNPITATATMISVAAGMTFYNTNLAIDSLRNGVADIARAQLSELPERALPGVEKQVDDVFSSFTTAYLKAIDTLVGQEWDTLKAIRDEKEKQVEQSASETVRLNSMMDAMAACQS